MTIRISTTKELFPTVFKEVLACKERTSSRQEYEISCLGGTTTVT